jgi:hypothetical protein
MHNIMGRPRMQSIITIYNLKGMRERNLGGSFQVRQKIQLTERTVVWEINESSFHGGLVDVIEDHKVIP